MCVKRCRYSIVVTKLLVIQHEENCPADLCGKWWQELGADLNIVYGPAQPIPETLGDHDALVVLGGGMNCYTDAENPWLSATRDLIAHTVAAGKPFLGICLGHQLAAVALGGKVEAKEKLSLGITPVGWNENAKEDLLFQSVVAEDTVAVQYNYDHVVQLPPGAVVLANYAGDGHVQAVRFAPLAWGVQFHPEASETTFGGWTVGKDSDKQPTAPEGRTIAEVYAEVEHSQERLQMIWRRLAARFLQVVQDSQNS